MYNDWRAGAHSRKLCVHQALLDLDAALRLQPDSLNALVGRGQTYMALRQYDVRPAPRRGRRGCGR
ncbi:hypothetical protein [Reyranella sp. CPCC 100927]|uniref:hypothetical protein n=1 Tax=Reyranella sp. CPCC 100927 TaxID=2599616 RepID=UPI0011B823E0|nr:hypothetical protein [Reyranella sp. CPCC 100927]TWT10104.1 hypothetical protein FQU96_18610 [Reyranella sp. CPCC 100927]